VSGLSTAEATALFLDDFKNYSSESKENKIYDAVIKPLKLYVQ
jgi:hypothetical protein